MSDDDTLAYMELSMLLAPNDEPKVFCDDRRFNQWGRVAVTCTRNYGHEGGHVDCHTGKKWDR